MFERAKSFFNQYKWLTRILVFGIIFVIVHAIVITVDGVGTDSGQADVAIVLGNRVFADGTLASWTKGRVDKALELYQAGRVKKIFVSGGLGVEDHYPEGKAMKQYLISKGVPDSAVIADDAGANTYLTMKNFLEWNKSNGHKSVFMISQFFHITRSVYILKKLGFEGEIHEASSEWYNIRDVTSTLREVPAFYKYAVVY